MMKQNGKRTNVVKGFSEPLKSFFYFSSRLKYKVIVYRLQWKRIQDDFKKWYKTLPLSKPQTQVIAEDVFVNKD